MIRPLALAFAVLALMPGAASGYAAFRTPGEAAYCGTSEAPPVRLVCWTPNDGFTVTMSRRSHPRKAYIPANRGHVENLARVLRFGWAWRQEPFVCTSRSNGLTCVNARGHGWWLGRYIGYRLF